MKRSLAAILCAAPLFAATPALAQPAAPDACLQPNRIRDFDPQPDNRTIIVTDTLNRKYKVTLQYPCLDLKWRMSLAFQPLSGSRLECLARNDRVVERRGQGMPGDRCLVDTITAYTPAMEKADKAAKAMDRPHQVFYAQVFYKRTLAFFPRNAQHLAGEDVRQRALARTRNKDWARVADRWGQK